MAGDQTALDRASEKVPDYKSQNPPGLQKGPDFLIQCRFCGSRGMPGRVAGGQRTHSLVPEGWRLRTLLSQPPDPAPLGLFQNPFPTVFGLLL